MPVGLRHSFLISLLFLSSFSVLSNEQTESSDELTEVERVVSSRIGSSIWEQQDPYKVQYDDPYKISLFDAQNGEDSARLWSQTKSIFGYGFGVIGVIWLLPDEISNWDKDGKFLKKWGDNVTNPPVWDRDVFWINYLGHPYFGGVYYQAARKSGYRQWDSFMYSFLMSTFYWEYGVEAFAERPSIQDLVVTPVLGWVVGEYMFQTEQSILANGGKVMGKEWLGSTALFFLDPVDSLGRGINNLFDRDIVRAGTGFISVHEVPVGNNGDNETMVRYNIEYTLGSGGRQRASYQSYDYTKVTGDPVDTSIVGIGVGLGQTSLDDDWGVENATTLNASLGLYFSRKYSLRLQYARGHADDLVSGEEYTYENYGLSGQRYFQTDKDLRPFLSLGFGEEMKDQDRDRSTFVTSLGAGLYYKLNNNWSIEGEAKRLISTRYKTRDDLFSLNLIYRFNKGEWLE
ncbi:DUF3943 domain-containing protein [Thalassotalea sp. LPB0316]|uniref:DUF3943 domain-containing protein n=1 Tax=Thalassotalea sp. LPB0316 TaxID=2769490 RepID=UPI001865DABF|nr:DUF3943 domain-containing protein [Thalassotalea sp. LPB0316]QOL25344.1 DUF3943 domain-containing protein [Thalassotalea sp. LPB0316]